MLTPKLPTIKLFLTEPFPQKTFSVCHVVPKLTAKIFVVWFVGKFHGCYAVCSDPQPPNLGGKGLGSDEAVAQVNGAVGGCCERFVVCNDDEGLSELVAEVEE